MGTKPGSGTGRDRSTGGGGTQSSWSENVAAATLRAVIARPVASVLESRLGARMATDHRVGEVGGIAPAEKQAQLPVALGRRAGRIRRPALEVGRRGSELGFGRARVERGVDVLALDAERL